MSDMGEIRISQPDNILLTPAEGAELQAILDRGDPHELARWLEANPGTPAHTVTAAIFREELHPRHPAGSERGGEWAPKGGAPVSTTAEPVAESGVEKGPLAQELLGDAVDTLDLYTDEQGNWDPARLNMHDRMVARFLAAGVEQEEPETLFLAGGSGSGKTTILKQMDDLPPDAVSVNPDEIKELLPEYQQLTAAGDKYAAMAVHEESSVISKRLLAEAYLRDYNVVLDGTGDAHAGKFLGKVEEAQDLGRYTRVVMADLPTDEAIRRVHKRAEHTGRWIPDGEVQAIHQAVAARHLEWADDLDDWEVWSTDVPEGEPPIMVARGLQGVTTIYDRERYTRLRRKAQGEG